MQKYKVLYNINKTHYQIMSGLGPRPHVHTRVMSAAVASSDGKRPILSMHCHSTQKMEKQWNTKVCVQAVAQLPQKAKINTFLKNSATSSNSTYFGFQSTVHHSQESMSDTKADRMHRKPTHIVCIEKCVLLPHHQIRQIGQIIQIHYVLFTSSFLKGQFSFVCEDRRQLHTTNRQSIKMTQTSHRQ